MLLLIGKSGELCLDAGAVAWAGALNLSVVEWRVGDGGHQRAMYLGVSVAGPARQLF